MTTRYMRALTLALLAGAAAGLPACSGSGLPGTPTPGATPWVATWAPSQQLTEPRNLPPAPGLTGSTLRQHLQVTIGGERLRVRFSNIFGNGPVVLGRAHIALSAGGGTIRSDTDRPLTFAGQPSVTIPAGGAVISDVLAYSLQPGANVAVTVEIRTAPPDVTGHPGSRTTSYLQSGDLADATAMPGAVKVEHWYLLAGIDVVAPAGATVVALGNSITDGRGSGTDRNDRWTDNLARRLLADPRTAGVAVVNEGLGGNCVLKACLGPAALARLDRDVLDQPGARWMIVLEGVNDIGGARGAAGSDSVAEGLIAAYRQMIDKVHARGIKAYGATILPFGGSFYDSPEHEAARQKVNAWIRTGGAFDAVIDLDARMRDPAQPSRLRAEADTGDHLHPNEAGYRMLADAIDLALFTARR